MTGKECAKKSMKRKKPMRTRKVTDKKSITEQTPVPVTNPMPKIDDAPLVYQVSANKSQAGINMARTAFDKMMSAICSRPAESGGLLLGPIDSNDVTDFFFDANGNVSGISYSPDCATLRHKLKTEWMPAGTDYKGFAHSHPRTSERLSPGDMAYIRKLLVINPEMELFIAPIIIPSEFRVRMMVVFRDNPAVAVDAQINFF